MRRIDSRNTGTTSWKCFIFWSESDLISNGGNWGHCEWFLGWMKERAFGFIYMCMASPWRPTTYTWIIYWERILSKKVNVILSTWLFNKHFPVRLTLMGICKLLFFDLEHDCQLRTAYESTRRNPVFLLILASTSTLTSWTYDMHCIRQLQVLFQTILYVEGGPFEDILWKKEKVLLGQETPYLSSDPSWHYYTKPHLSPDPWLLTHVFLGFFLIHASKCS